jgi:EpsI family protein
MTRSRILIVLVSIALAGSLRTRVRAHADAGHVSLGSLPYGLAGWSGRDAAPLDEDTARELAADSYLTRRYASASPTPVDLYIAYYGQQRPGVSIHSPLHCLPGTGWETLDVGTIDVSRAQDGSSPIRRLLVQKTTTRAVVLYWYVIHGRTLDGELASKFWLLHDAISIGRTDAALVRVVVPIVGDQPDVVHAAERQGMAFVQALLPHLPSLWS